MEQNGRRSAYADKLRDPRWQKLRLEVMERDQWMCNICINSTSTLHVHHRYYLPDKEPWEYPLDALATLCERCHELEAHARRRAEEQRLLHALKVAGFYIDDVARMADAFSHVHNANGTQAEAMSMAIAWLLSNQMELKSLIDRVDDKRMRLFAERLLLERAYRP
jgi:hypothetical protein